MKILFWQNMISRHQQDLLESLVELGNDISVVIESDISRNRKQIGWDTIKYENIKVYKIKDILNKYDERFLKTFDYHIFSSISSYKYLYKGFKLCEKLEVPIMIYSENKDLRGFKGFIRFLTSKIDYWKHKNSIKKIFAIGDTGVEYFKKLGFSEDKIIEYGYYISPEKVTSFKKNSAVKFTFIGNLSHQKGFDKLLNIITSTNIFKEKELDIYGDGLLKQDILTIAATNHNVNYFGSVGNREILSKINKYDYLILPSNYDGWGVVVNEALLHGCNVITTTAVGSSSILKSFPNSYVVKSKNNEKNLAYLLAELKPLEINEKKLTIATANKLLHPRMMAKKLINEIKKVDSDE